MSGASAKKEDFFKRSVPLKGVFVLVAAMVVIMVAIVVILVLVDRDRDEARRLAAASVTSSTVVTSPYDFAEMPTDTDLGALEDAAFVSILLANDQGAPTSYGISSDRPAAQALSEAIGSADELDSGEAATITAAFADASAAGPMAASTITFVFADRGTLTFLLDLDEGVVARGEHVWRTAEDLRTLVEAALVGNQ